MKPLLLILDDWEGRIADSPAWAPLRDLVDIKFLAGPLDKAAPSSIQEARFIMAIRERTALTADIFAKLPNLELILQTGGHAYHIDTGAALAHGITIALGRKVKAPLLSVPELTIAMCLGCMHLLPLAGSAMREGKWPLLTGRTLCGRRLGILGMGRHGTRVAEIASTAFGMEVVAWDRPGSGKAGSNHIPRLPLDELLNTSDIVSIHLRLSPESKRLINAERLAKMKTGAILVNTARGAIVDETALIQALQAGHLSAAGLDVFEQEPLPATSPFRSMPNVMLTPHIGWTVEEVFDEFARIAASQLQDYLTGTLAASEILAP